jgi:hypothetical protein
MVGKKPTITILYSLVECILFYKNILIDILVIVIILLVYVRFYSIPDACECKFLEDTECVYGLPYMEVPMDENNETAINKITKWLLNKSFLIVIILSVFVTIYNKKANSRMQKTG